tara:strand:+ start:561 stop:851 length:291 start_codon:yes stop_codon:yes gene_type:complete
MFEISTLKEKKIIELQKIASDLGVEKITGLKKMDLAYKIIDHYASNPTISKNIEKEDPVTNKKKEYEEKTETVIKDSEKKHTKITFNIEGTVSEKR